MGGEVVAVGIGSIVFAYVVLLRLPIGIPRFLASLPWIALLYRTAWSVPTIHLRALVSFFFVWMIPSKLLLLCWNAGPAQDPAIRSSFPQFFATTALSIHIPRCDPAFLPQDDTDPRRDPSPAAPPDRDSKANKLDRNADFNRLAWIQESLAWPAVLIRASIKLLLVVALFAAYAFRHHGMPELVLYLVYSLHVYLACSLIFEALAAAAAAATGVTLEPQFDQPYLASSITDFWGRRWNRLVSSMLRASVYEPVLALGYHRHTATAKCPGRPPTWLRATATMVTFLVSGLMHEVIFLYLNKSAPTWQVTGFFLVNGLAAVVEAAARRSGTWSTASDAVPTPVRVALTVGFVYGTAAALFFPPIQTTGTCFQVLEEFEQMLGLLTTSTHLEK